MRPRRLISIPFFVVPRGAQPQVKLARAKARIDATAVSFLEHSVSESVFRLDLDKVSAIFTIPMLNDVSHLRSRTRPRMGIESPYCLDNS